MTVERLISALWTEAELKERAVTDEARETAGKIAAACEEAVLRLNAQIENRKKYLTASREALSASNERLRGRKAELYAVAGAMETVRNATRGLFREFMKSPAYLPYLLRQIGSVKKEGVVIGEIRADAMTAQTLRKAGVQNVIDDATVENGFVAVAQDGMTRVFCLLETSLEKLRKQTAPRLVAQITQAVTRGD
jgi:hypothetical protein